jgi:hypothetical protein
VSAVQSAHNNVLEVFTNLNHVLANVLDVFVNLIRVLVKFSDIFADSICVLMNVLGIFSDPLRVHVDILLYRCLPGTLDSLWGSVGCTHLVIYHSSSQVLDDTVQGFGIASILQELLDIALLGKRSEFLDHISQLPANSPMQFRCVSVFHRRVVSQTFEERPSGPSPYRPGHPLGMRDSRQETIPFLRSL